MPIFRNFPEAIGKTGKIELPVFLTFGTIFLKKASLTELFNFKYRPVFFVIFIKERLIQVKAMNEAVVNEFLLGI